MSNDRKIKILAAGLKAGGKDGYSLKQQLGSLLDILTTNKVNGTLSEAILEEVKDSGILNASATLQWLKKNGIVTEKIDPKLQEMFMAALK